MSSHPTFSVTDVVTAARCPRQLVLMKRGHRVVPYGDDAFGKATHAALTAAVLGARDDAALHALLDRPLPDRAATEAAIFRLAHAGAYGHAKRVARNVDGGDLARFADSIRRISSILAPLLAQAAARATNGAAAVASTLLASEEDVVLELDGVTIRGRIDLACNEPFSGEKMIWDLKTYSGSDLAQHEQVRLYAMAYAARGISARPALVHVARDGIEISRADEPREGDAAKLVKLAGHMASWLEGTPPPPAFDQATCRTCPAQSTCWRVWNRTLPDEDDDVAAPAPPAIPEDRPTAPTTDPDDEPRAVDPTPARAASAPRAPAVAKAAPVAMAPSVAKAPSVPIATPPVGAAPPAPLAQPPLWIGKDAKNNPVTLAPQEIVRHTAVFGAAGSGKTYLAKSIVEEAVLAGIPVLAFDVQGDILQLAEPLEDGDPALDDAHRSRRDAYRRAADVRLLTPMSDAGLRTSLNPLRFPAEPLPDEQATVYAEAVAENLLAHVRIPAGWRDHARSYLAERIQDEMKRVRSLAIEDLVAGIANDDSVDDLLIDSTQRAKLVKDLRLLTRGSKKHLFELGRPLDLDALLGVRTPGKTPLNVLWLNGLGDQQNKESFVAMVLADLYAWMLRQRGGEPKVLLYFDEIGPYMPPHGEPASKKMLKRIFKEGRKYGVCGLFATQNFTDVDYKVVSQASTVAVGRINAAQEKKKAIDSIGAAGAFDVYAAVDSLMSAPRGRFVLKRVEGNPHWLQGRSLVTRHGGTWGEEEIRAHTPDELRVEWARAAT